MKIILTNDSNSITYQKKFDHYSKTKEVQEFIKLHILLLRQGYEVLTKEKEEVKENE